MNILLAFCLLFLLKWFILEFVFPAKPWLIGFSAKESLKYSLSQGVFSFVILLAATNQLIPALTLGFLECLLSLGLSYLLAFKGGLPRFQDSLEVEPIPFSEKARQEQNYRVLYTYWGFKMVILISFNLSVAIITTHLAMKAI